MIESNEKHWEVADQQQVPQSGHDCPKRNRKYPFNQLDNSCVGSSVDTVCDHGVLCNGYYSHVYQGSKTVGYVDEEGRPWSSSNDIAACTGEHAENPEPLEFYRYWGARATIACVWWQMRHTLVASILSVVINRAGKKRLVLNLHS